jgi:hypothetical protein
LRLIGPQADILVPELAAMAKNPDSLECFYAVPLLGAIHARPEISIPAIMEALRRADFVDIRTAAEALGKFGPAAKDAVATLVVRWRGSTAGFDRDDLARAIKQIDPIAASKEGIQ